MALKWIGLTGGIGTGKSTVAGLLREAGYHVIDADELAREAVKKGSPGFAAVIKKFGSSVQTKDGELDRTAMAQLVFQSKENLTALEEIIHPIVRKLADEHRKNLEKKGVTHAFYDVPLLFEKKMEPMFDSIVVVVSSEQNQIQRLKSRNGWAENEVRRRLNNQIALEEKAKKAHYVVPNDGSLEHLKVEVEKLLKKLNL